MVYVIIAFVVIFIIAWILDTFGTQLGILTAAIIVGFAAFGVFKALKNYVAAFKKCTIDSNRS